ncbi:MAG: hypothetical protein N2319_08110 [Candidatus Kapabacteria bacterium]|nr:hypothetical protein [Candidatus Kapabacteria bacterium]
MKALIIISFIIVYGFVSCTNKNPEQTEKNKTTETTQKTNEGKGGGANEAEKEATKVQDVNPEMYSDVTHYKPYELKEDGLYIYYDGPKLSDKVDKKCESVKLKNYKYQPVPSQRTNIKTDEMKTWQYCQVIRECESNLGKPSLRELGYERHKEREIKPEDNRFGQVITKKEKWTENERRIKQEIFINYIDSDKFMKMSRQEFLENGVVIIGKRISRVVVKKSPTLPFFYTPTRIPVSFTVKNYNCDGLVNTNEYGLVQLGDFKRIDLKENIFEFIQEEPLPGNASYLSDLQMKSLSEYIHQLIPRHPYDGTVHKSFYYPPGYYFIEYYNGDQLYDYLCIQLISAPYPPPAPVKPLSFNKPAPPDSPVSEKGWALILGKFNTLGEASNFIKMKDPYPLVVLSSKDGKYYAGRMFYDKNAAEMEKKRILNTGVSRQAWILDIQEIQFNVP